MPFYLFLLAVALYAAFVVWCLAAPFRKHRTRAVNWARFAIGILLLGANFLPPLTLLMTVGGETAMAVPLFLRTTHPYVISVARNARADATVVEVVVPIDIRGIRYAPVMKIACSTRNAISIDKGDIHSFNGAPTISNGELAGLAGDDVLALRFGENFCSQVLRGKLGVGVLPGRPEWLGDLPEVNVIRKTPERATIYRLHWDGKPLTVDDIVLSQLQVTRIAVEPARDVMPWGDLWPVIEKGNDDPEIMFSYRTLSRTAKECVHFVDVRFDRRKNAQTVSRPRPDGKLLPASSRWPARGYDRGYLKEQASDGWNRFSETSKPQQRPCDAHLENIKAPAETLTPTSHS